MRPLDVAAFQEPKQLVVVVARREQGRPGGDHARHRLQHGHRVRPPVRQVADEDRDAPFRVARQAVLAPDVPQRLPQTAQLRPAPMHVPDHVKRLRLARRRPLRDRHRLHVRHRENVKARKGRVPGDLPLGVLERRVVTPDDRLAHLPVGPPGVAPQALVERHVQQQREAGDVVPLRRPRQPRPRVRASAPSSPRL